MLYKKAYSVESHILTILCISGHNSKQEQSQALLRRPTDWTYCSLRRDMKVMYHWVVDMVQQSLKTCVTENSYASNFGASYATVASFHSLTHISMFNIQMWVWPGSKAFKHTQFAIAVNVLFAKAVYRKPPSAMSILPTLFPSLLLSSSSDPKRRFCALTWSIFDVPTPIIHVGQ